MPSSGSTCSIRMASGSASSTSMPPMRESITIGFLAERSNTIAA